MASNPKDPMSKFFEVDIAGGKRSNFNWSYKNRLTADYGYIIPVGLWDVPSDVHFELDLFASLSSNPTLAPILGKVKFRVEAYFVEKAAYVSQLRNNNKMPIDRNVQWPVAGLPNTPNMFSPRSGIMEFLQMFPADFCTTPFTGDSPADDAVPVINAIPLIMYYDIYRNYYVNPQDDSFPIRVNSYVPAVKSTDGETTSAAIPIHDIYRSRENLDNFVDSIRNEIGAVEVYEKMEQHLGFVPYALTTRSSGFPNQRDHAKYKHLGLLRRTLNNDFFTSFISNENVELMKSSANVAVSSIGGQQVVNVEQISLANRNWRIRTRSLLWGTDWKDYNKVHYGVNLMIPYGRPQFLGALSSDITFNDVISQAQTGAQNSSPILNQNLGSRAALAFGGLQNHKGRFVEFNTKDEGYVMVVASLVPEVDYYQGIDPMYFKTNLQHSWMVELNSVGMQDFHRAWMTVITGDDAFYNPGWSTWNVAEHKVPIWFEYMAKYNQLHGDFTDELMNRYWVFARPFTNLNELFPGIFSNVNPSDDNHVPFTSTYVLPEMFNYIFANNIGNDNFQLQFRFDCKVSSMLDKQVIAYL